MDYKNLLYQAIIASLHAGQEIVKIYNTDFTVDYKKDNSPVTLADKNASDKIETLLAPLNIPFLSEESEEVNYEVRKKWEQYWLVDPLDGTKEFVKKSKEFTVNIALINNRNAEIGVIYAPLLNELYFAAKNLGAYKLAPINSNEFINNSIFLSLDDIILKATKLPIHHNLNEFVVVASKSHLSTETFEHIKQLGHQHKSIKTINIGSSLKLCLIAEGLAHQYPRFGNIMEWDTAAGHAILNESGAEIIDQTTQLPLIYNKQNLKNNWFIAQKKG